MLRGSTKQASVAGFVLGSLLLCLVRAGLAQETVGLDEAFRRLVDETLKGAEYVTERARFLHREGVVGFLQRAVQDGGDAHARALTMVLRRRGAEREVFLALQSRFGSSITTIVQAREERRPRTVHGRESRPDPMFRLMLCLSRERIESIRARALRAAQKAVAAGHSPSGYWAHGYLPPGETAESYLQKVRRGVDATYWDRETPALGFAMLETALKGWPDEEAVAELKRKGWGDFYRYMAVHLLGELRFGEAVDWMVQVLGGDGEDVYLRAHAARALSKIADPTVLSALARSAFGTKVSDVVRREVRFDSFDALDVTRVLLKLLLESDGRDTKITLVNALQSQGRRAPDANAMAQKALRVMAKDDDIQVRLAARRGLERLSGAVGSRASRVKDTWLEYDSCLPATDWKLLREAADGNADPARLADARRRYVAIIDEIAAGYTHGNVFATRDLHSKGWPSVVGNGDPRAFFESASRLRQGMSKAQVLAALSAGLQVQPHDTDYSLGESVEYLRARRRFNEEVEVSFGLKRPYVEFALVFIEGKLRILHSPHR